MKKNTIKNDFYYKDINNNKYNDFNIFNNNKFNNDISLFEPNINDLEKRIMECVNASIDDYLKKHNLKEEEISIKSDADMVIDDVEIISIIEDFIESHIELREEILTKKLTAFFENIHSRFKASVLADIGIEKLKALNIKSMKPKERKLAEAQIMILFLQKLMILKEYDHLRDYSTTGRGFPSDGFGMLVNESKCNDFQNDQIQRGK